MGIQYINTDILHNMIMESLSRVIGETVYMSGVNKKKKQVDLTYAKGTNYSKGNINANDKLKTDKMDVNNDDTYMVPLKGGIMSYNITSIKGSEVMHYFKRYFNNQKTNVKVGDDTYELAMKDAEFKQFIDQFVLKVRNVINHAVSEYNQTGDFDINKVSIYPVPSSSNFNIEMAKLMAHGNYLGYDTSVINDSLFVKDLRNLEKDTDFINKNKEFYQTNMSNTGAIPGSVEDNLDKDLNRSKTIKIANRYTERMNACIEAMLIMYYDYNATKDKQNEKTTASKIQKIADAYMEYCDYKEQCMNLAVYDNPTTERGVSRIKFGDLMEPITYTKGPSVEKRTTAILNLIKPLLRGKTSDITSKPYIIGDKMLPICRWSIKPFKIQNLPNSSRLGMKNIYNPNKDEQIVNDELNKIKGTVFVVFDDNISGGATLSDVCYQAKQLGIEYIVPITFGKMNEKEVQGTIRLATPKDGYNME